MSQTQSLQSRILRNIQCRNLFDRVKDSKGVYFSFLDQGKNSSINKRVKELRKPGTNTGHAQNKYSP